MPKRIEGATEVVVRGEVVKVEEGCRFPRVRFPRYQYPTHRVESAIEQVVKPPKPKFKRLRDVSD